MIQRCKTGALTATSATKLLGTSFAAGARRSVHTLRDRILRVKKIAHRAQQLTRLGLSAVEYVRGAAIPAMLYGSEIMGMSDSMTHDACVVAAAALAPPTAGKDPTLVVHAAAVHSIDTNPVVMANVAPIKTWACAWWDSWEEPDALVDAFKKGNTKVSNAWPLPWNAVNGPAAALAATCRRLRWRTDDGKLFRDDVGDLLDASRDSPKAFANAARRSAVRLQTDAMLKSIPAAAPKGCDISFHSTFAASNEREGGRKYVLVDLVPFLRPLYRG